jgi:flagellar motility protein MotE (MotC chaperone)
MKEVMKEVKNRNEKTLAWVAADPKNRFASLYIEEESHWIELGIHTLEDLERYELISYIYEGHKDAFGVKGRHYNFDDMSLQELREESGYIRKSIAEALEAKESLNQQCLTEFQEQLEKIIENGAKDEETALRWLVSEEDFQDQQDVESWLFDRGILFTDYGQSLFKRLKNSLKFKKEVLSFCG